MEKDKTTSTEQLKELLSKITQGGWYVSKNKTTPVGNRCYKTIYNTENPNVNTVVLFNAFGERDNDATANAELISLAPTLAAEVIELREQNKVLREALRKLNKEIIKHLYLIPDKTGNELNIASIKADEILNKVI